MNKEEKLAPIICLRCAATGAKTNFKGNHNVLCPLANRKEIEDSGQLHINAFARLWNIVQLLISQEKDKENE